MYMMSLTDAKDFPTAILNSAIFNCHNHQNSQERDGLDNDK